MNLCHELAGTRRLELVERFLELSARAKRGICSLSEIGEYCGFFVAFALWNANEMFFQQALVDR